MAGGLVPQDDETPVGLLEEFQQTVDDARQEGVDFERVAEAVADFQDDAEPVGGLRLQGLTAAVLIDGVLDGERGIRRLVEGADEVADAYAVVVVEQDAPGNGTFRSLTNVSLRLFLPRPSPSSM